MDIEGAHQPRLVQAEIQNPNNHNLPEGARLVNLADVVGIRKKSSKSDLLLILQVESTIFLLDGCNTPPDRMASMEFVRQILSGEKLLLQSNQVRHIRYLERFPALTIASLLAWGRDNIPELDRYIPDFVDQDYSKVDRLFLASVESNLIKICNTLNENSIERLRLQALQDATNRNNQNQEPAMIRLAPQFANIFNNRLVPLGGNRRLLGALIQPRHNRDGHNN